MDDSRPAQAPVTVEPAEAGQKLLRFLARRFGVPETVAHRWVRTGQVRVNGGRTKPFARLEAGDSVRVPPMAAAMTRETAEVIAQDGPGLPPVVAREGDLLVLAKPAGLPVHPGSGHEDSLTTRLARRFAGAAFMPAPAHRLDADTSGLLLVATSYTCLRELHEWFKAGGAIKKEYLAWVSGVWPEAEGRTVLLSDTLSRNKVGSGNMERIALAPLAQNGLEAKAEVTLIKHLDLPAGPVSLLRVRLLTGRTHQIRAQMSARGHPLINDRKYQGPAARRYGPGAHPPLYLHAARIVLPDGLEFTLVPDWPEPFSVPFAENGP